MANPLAIEEKSKAISFTLLTEFLSSLISMELHPTCFVNPRSCASVGFCWI